MKYLFLLFTISLYSCINPTEKESFEGVITYKIDRELIYHQEVSNEVKEYLEQIYGNELKLYYDKNGNIARKFTNSGNRGWDYQIYNAQKNKQYVKMKHLDTLYYGDVSKNYLKLISKTVSKNIEIRGQKCKSLEITGIIPEYNEKVIMKYYYNGKPYLNSKLFASFKDFFNDEYFKISKSPALKFEFIVITDDITQKTTYTSSNIERKKLDKSIFEIPKDAILKKD